MSAETGASRLKNLAPDLQLRSAPPLHQVRRVRAAERVDRKRLPCPRPTRPGFPRVRESGPGQQHVVRKRRLAGPGTDLRREERIAEGPEHERYLRAVRDPV